MEYFQREWWDYGKSNCIITAQGQKQRRCLKWSCQDTLSRNRLGKVKSTISNRVNTINLLLLYHYQYVTFILWVIIYDALAGSLAVHPSSFSMKIHRMYYIQSKESFPNESFVYLDISKHFKSLTGFCSMNSLGLKFFYLFL